MGILEQPRHRRLRFAGLIGLAGLLAWAGWAFVAVCCAPPAPARVAAPERHIPGEGQRVVVEVLNASGATGLARAATGRLRDEGLDVIFYGSDTTAALDSTEILVRRGDEAVGARARRALGLGRVTTAPDAARLVDLTIRLGRDLAATLRDP